MDVGFCPCVASHQAYGRAACSEFSIQVGLFCFVCFLKNLLMICFRATVCSLSPKKEPQERVVTLDGQGRDGDHSAGVWEGQDLCHAVCCQAYVTRR